jgi:hypothetical protein
MSKKNYTKQFEKFLGEVLDEETALLGAGLILVEAFHAAQQKGNIKELLDIADRWMILSKMLSANPEEAEVVNKYPLGFTFVEEESLDIEQEVYDDDKPEGPNKSKSRIEIRKKLR